MAVDLTYPSAEDIDTGTDKNLLPFKAGISNYGDSDEEGKVFKIKGFREIAIIDDGTLFDSGITAIRVEVSATEDGVFGKMDAQDDFLTVTGAVNHFQSLFIAPWNYARITLIGTNTAVQAVHFNLT